MNRVGQEQDAEQQNEIQKLKEEIYQLRKAQNNKNNKGMLEILNVGVALLRDNEIIFANLELLDIFGYEQKADMIGHSLYDFVDSDTVRQSIKKAINKDFTSSNPLECEFVGYRKDGKSFDGLLVLGMIVYEGEIVVQAVITNISDRKRAERAEAELKRLDVVQQLAMAIAHEFNNPLAIMKGALRLMMQPGYTGEKHAKQAERINNQIKRMSDLTQKLLKLKTLKEMDYIQGIKILDLHNSSE